MLDFKASERVSLNKLRLFIRPMVRMNKRYGWWLLNTNPWRIHSLVRSWTETDDGALQNPCHLSCRRSEYGGGVGKAGRNNIELIWACFYSEDSETCPLTTRIDKSKQSSIKEKESERRRKALIDMRASWKAPWSAERAASCRWHKFFWKIDVNWRLDVLLRAQDTNVHLSISLHLSFNLFPSTSSLSFFKEVSLTHTSLIYWWYNGLMLEFAHSHPE